jgi:hypothetical protein
VSNSKKSHGEEDPSSAARFVSVQFRHRQEQRGGESSTAEVRRESAAAKAERIVAQELARLGWDEEQLKRQRKNAPEKLALAARLRQETILPIKSIGVGHLQGSEQELACLDATD